MSRQDIKALATVGVVILIGAVLVMLLGLNAVAAQESDDAPPAVSARQSDNETSTPITIDPPDSDDPESDDVTGLSAPSRPGRPSVSGVGHNAITLSWGAVSGATHYDARYRDRDAGGTGVPGSWSQTDGISGTSRTFSGLSPSTRYEFEVRAGNASGDSSWSPNRYGTTTAAPIALSLPDPSDRTLTKDVSTSFTLPSARGGTASYSYSVSGLPAGLSFTASSRTVSGTPTATGTSTVTYSVTDSASPAATRTQTFTITVTTGTVLSAPGRPSVTGTTQNSVSLSWGAVTGATHYDARYRDRDAGGTDIPGSWSQTNDISGTSQTFSGLTPSTRYEFEVRAGNAVGDSAWSPNRYGTTDSTTITPNPTPTPEPTVDLSASPTTMRIGDTTTLTSSNVPSSVTQAKLVYDTKLTHRSACPEVQGASNHDTVTLSSPNSSVTLIGCWPGTASVSLQTSADVELDSVSVTVTAPTVEISGLGSSLTNGQSDSFDVSVSNVSSSVTYRIETLAGDADLSFTDCGNPDTTDESGSLSGSTSYDETFTLYACNVGGATVFASLLHGNRTIGLASQHVTVTEPTSPPPPPPPPPPPRPTPPPPTIVNPLRWLELTPSITMLKRANHLSMLPEATGGTPRSSDPEYTYTLTLADGSALPSWLIQSGAILSGTPTESGTFQTKYTAIDGAGASIQQPITIVVEEPVHPQFLNPKLHLNLKDGKSVSGNPELENDTYWLLLANYSLKPVDTGDVNYEPYEWKLRIPASQGISIVANNTTPCAVTGTHSQQDSGWLNVAYSGQYIDVARCRLGSGSGSFELFARIKGEPASQRKILTYDVSLVKAPHYANHKVVYRFCDDPVEIDDSDFSKETDKGATDWNNADVGVKYSSAAAIDGCKDDGEDGFTQVYHVSYTDMMRECGSAVAWGCAKYTGIDDGVHFDSHDVVYVHPPRPTKEWTTATGDVDGDTAHVEAIMTHELGHVAGLGHAKTSSLMKGGFNPDILGLKLYDRQAMRLIYKVHTSH